MLAGIATLVAFPALALAAITITGPNSNQYWVQNTTKTITWTYANGDPNPISIIIVNSDSTYLNGAFSIDEYVDLTLKSYTITNITLSAGPGFQVEFVNPGNHSDVYATSNTFTVMPSGTAPSQSSTVPSGASGSVSGTGTVTGTASGSSSSTSKSGAVKLDSMMYMVAVCGLVALCSFML